MGPLAPQLSIPSGLSQELTLFEALCKGSQRLGCARHDVGRTLRQKSDGRQWPFGKLAHTIDGVKAFLLFTYYAGRPLGGAKDFLGDFDSVEEALENILEERQRYFQIVDYKTMLVAKEGLAWFKHFDPRVFRRDADPIFPTE